MVRRCLEPLLGQDTSLDLAATRALEHHLEELRRPSAAHVARLVAARAKGPQGVLAACDAVLAASPPAIARGYALWQRGRALEALGRAAEALAAFDDLHRRRLEHPAYVERARIGRARSLRSLGRREDAMAELARLERDAFSPDVAVWAKRTLADLASEQGQR